MNKLTLGRIIVTRHTTRYLSALLGLAIVSSACNGEAPIPTGPTPTPTPTTTVTYALSGAVLETTASGSAPIEGARVVDVSSGLSATTDTLGLFSIPGLPTRTRSISVTRSGYATHTTTVTMDHDIQLEIRLERMVSYTLSGVVFEITAAGQVPIEGVEIYCDSCGSPDGHTFVYTDADGFYSLSWTPNGVHPLFVRKVGYGIFNPTGRLPDTSGRISATVRGDTRFDIQLARP